MRLNIQQLIDDHCMMHDEEASNVKNDNIINKLTILYIDVD